MIALPEAWTPLRYHEVQYRLWNCKTQYAAVVAGRGSGKTELARRRTVLHLGIKKPWSNPIYVYALPTYAQAKKVAWEEFLRLIPQDWIPKNGKNVQEQSITTVFGSKLYIVGLDKAHRIEGLQIDGIVVDESSDQKPGVFDRTIRPMLKHRKGWAWRIGVPKRAGVGRPEFKAFFEAGLRGHPRISSFWWESADILSPEELENEMEDMDPQDFEEQYRAQWIDLGGTIYHCYSSENLSQSVNYDPTLPILVGCDFNVNPMAWCLAHKVEGKLEVFDEIFLKNTNTRKTLDKLYTKYESHRSGWNFYGDATGQRKQSSASKSDYLHIKNDPRFNNKRVVFPSKNPNRRDRFATVNAALRNAKEQIKVLIHPRCKRLINDFNVMSYQEGSLEPENYDGTDIGHISDAFGYLAIRTMPLRLERTGTPSIVTV